MFLLFFIASVICHVGEVPCHSYSRGVESLAQRCNSLTSVGGHLTTPKILIVIRFRFSHDDFTILEDESYPS